MDARSHARWTIRFEHNSVTEVQPGCLLSKNCNLGYVYVTKTINKTVNLDTCPHTVLRYIERSSNNIALFSGVFNGGI